MRTAFLLLKITRIFCTKMHEKIKPAAAEAGLKK